MARNAADGGERPDGHAGGSRRLAFQIGCGSARHCQNVSARQTPWSARRRCARRAGGTQLRPAALEPVARHHAVRDAETAPSRATSIAMAFGSGATGGLSMPGTRARRRDEVDGGRDAQQEGRVRGGPEQEERGARGQGHGGQSSRARPLSLALPRDAGEGTGQGIKVADDALVCGVTESQPSPPPRPRRWPRRARRVGLALAGVVVAWVALAIHPQPLFAYSAQRANIVLHARVPLPPQAGPLLDDVVRRVERSPLYDAGRTHHVFLCDTPSVFALFALWDRRVGGSRRCTWAATSSSGRRASSATASSGGRARDAGGAHAGLLHRA